jgi:K+-transporting ATPase A subunit
VAQGFLQVAIFCALLIAAMPLLGGYMARVFTGGRVFMTPVIGPLERVTYRLMRSATRTGRSTRAGRSSSRRRPGSCCT